LGGVFAIAAVVDHFSDAVVQNPIVGQASKNPELHEWHTNQLSSVARPFACRSQSARCRETTRTTG
jgi:hypothetical protein